MITSTSLNFDAVRVGYEVRTSSLRKLRLAQLKFLCSRISQIDSLKIAREIGSERNVSRQFSFGGGLAKQAESAI